MLMLMLLLLPPPRTGRLSSFTLRSRYFKSLALRSAPGRAMASAFTHAFAAVALGNMASGKARGWRFWVLAAGSAVLPDADIIGFAFGVDYGDLLGHRGFFHSLLFA